jgi:vacuolar-type H+-ATPase subunit E/Vma4
VKEVTGQAASASPPAGDSNAGEFVRKISEDRDRELAAIDAGLIRELKSVAKTARQASRRFHSEHAERARQSLQQEYDRRMSRARAAQRRKRWALLQETLDQAMWTASERLRQFWNEAERQADWCRHWVARAVEHAGGAPLVVRIGQGGLSATEADLRGLLSAYQGGYRLSMDDSIAEGVIVEWEDTLLDGRLTAQRERLADVIFAELTEWLHAEGLVTDEQG